MRRLDTALVALLALAALAGAAATFDAVDGPSVGDDGERDGAEPFTDAPPPTGVPAGGDESGVERAGTVTTPGGGSDEGVSPLFVPAFVGSLLASGLFVVLLTGDDERAPDGIDHGESEERDPTPSVDPAYDSPGDSAVYRAWHRLRERVDADETATPGEVATAAVDRRLPDEPVATITEQFRDARYGDGSPTDEQADRASAAEADLDADGETGR